MTDLNTDELARLIEAATATEWLANINRPEVLRKPSVVYDLKMPAYRYQGETPDA